MEEDFYSNILIKYNDYKAKISCDDSLNKNFWFAEFTYKPKEYNISFEYDEINAEEIKSIEKPKKRKKIKNNKNEDVEVKVDADVECSKPPETPTPPKPPEMTPINMDVLELNAESQSTLIEDV